MDDIAALRVTLINGESRYFLTWGRVADPVDPEPLKQLLWSALSGFSLGEEPAEVAVCQSLQEAAGAEYFFEGFFSLSQERIPYGPEYGAWAAGKLDRMREGKEFRYLAGRVGAVSSEPAAEG